LRSVDLGPKLRGPSFVEIYEELGPKSNGMRNLATFVAASAVTLGALVGCTKSQAAQGGGAAGGAEPKLPVEVQTLQEEPLADGAEYLAQLVSRHHVAVYPQVTGVVVQILVKPGDEVKAGTPLLQIDPRREAANLANQVAARQQREANLELAKRNEERAVGLFREGLVSRANFDQVKSAREVAEQDLQAQKASIVAQSTQLDYFRIVAPFGGTVGDIPVKLGDMVSANTKLTSIADNRNLEAYIHLPVEKLAQLHPTSQVQVLGVSGKWVEEPQVSFVAPETNPETQSVLIKAVIPNEAGVLRAAQVVRARVVFDSHRGVRVPVAAVTRQVGQYFVYVATNGKDGPVANMRPIEVGELDDNHYPVTKGLQPGDKLVTSNLQKLHDGTPVEPKEADSTASTKQN